MEGSLPSGQSTVAALSCPSLLTHRSHVCDPPPNDLPGVGDIVQEERRGLQQLIGRALSSYCQDIIGPSWQEWDKWFLIVILIATLASEPIFHCMSGDEETVMSDVFACGFPCC